MNDNRLGTSVSPYLRLHADNPVDWREWGPEAFAEARERGIDHVDVIYEAGEEGPEAFFRRVGFTPTGETEFGEVIAEIRL
jgi:predicted fused transcriptional regulator/phosphomethylpyrimidine kinase